MGTSPSETSSFLLLVVLPFLLVAMPGATNSFLRLSKARSARFVASETAPFESRPIGDESCAEGVEAHAAGGTTILQAS